MYANAEAIARRKANDELGERIARQAVDVNAAEHTLLTDIRAFHASGAWGHQGAKSMAHWLSYKIHLGAGAAREYVRVARKLRELPRIDAAAATGALSYSQLRAITRVATPTTEETLLGYAERMTGSQLEKLCRKFRAVQSGARAAKDEPDRRFVRVRPTADGMVEITARVAADEADLVMTVIDELAAKATTTAAESQSENVPAGTEACRVRPRTFDRADAFVAAFETVARGNAPERSPIEIVVSVSAEALHGPADRAETHVARRLGCDASMIPVMHDRNDNPLAVGRSKRLVSGKLARALSLRDPVCRFPGCSNALFLHAHHVQHWADGGETTLGNTVHLCSFHHRCAHEYGFRVEMVNGTPKFADPDGRPLEVVRPSTRPSPLPRASVGEPTNLWDGSRMDYATLVAALCHHECSSLDEE